MDLVKLMDVVKYRKQFIEIDDDTKYKRCRVQLHRRGVKLRDVIYGSEIKTKKQRLCKANNLIVAEMDAKFGGYGIIPNDLEGAIVSSHYYLYEMKPDKLLPMFLEVIIDSGELQKQIKAIGSTNYSRISAKEVLEYEIPCPSLQIQEKIIKYYFGNKACVTELKQELTHQQTLLKKLRQQILQEAIEGKLTAQWRKENPDTEPASVLLEKIKAEKAQLIKEKKICKEKPLSPITQEEIPFELPEGWVWCRFLDTAFIVRGGSPRPIGNYLTTDKNGVNWIKIGDTKNDNKYIYSTHQKIKKEGLKKSRFVEPGDFLLTNSMSFGRPYIMRTTGCIHDGWLLIKTPKKIINEDYLYYMLSSDYTYKSFKESARGGVVQNLNIDKVKETIIPIPPLPEQKAIVTKVEKLLALCDQLETQITTNQAQAGQLMQAVLKEAFEPDGQETGEKTTDSIKGSVSEQVN